MLDALQPNVVAIELLQGSRPIEHQAHTLQSITAIPLSIFENHYDLVTIVFPNLYPDGENDFGTISETKITQVQYFLARLLSAEPIWACHPSYIC